MYDGRPFGIYTCRTGHDDDIPAICNIRLKAPEGFPQPPTRTIAFNRIPEFAFGGYTKARVGKLIAANRT